MDLVLAESLVAVADAGAVTAAAQRIHISQSALSRRLQQLESDLGAQLLIRGRHGAELTEAGRLALVECRAMLARYETMRRDIAEHLGLRRGTVILGGGATVTSCLLPQAIAGFRANYPGIRFLVKEAGSHQVIEDVAQGRIQIGIVTLPVGHDDLEVTPLVEDEIVLVARRDDSLHPLADPADLNGRGVIAFEPGSAIRRIVDTSLSAAGVAVEVTMELRSVPSMLQMVSATGDLAFVSRLSLRNETELLTVQVKGLSITRSLALATRQGIPLTPAAEAFVQSLHTTVHRPRASAEQVPHARPEAAPDQKATDVAQN
jgi:DNA-binding transcriptional LysR family regulator